MGLAVVEGATLQCTLGLAESTLNNTSGRFIIECMRVATIKDHVALVQVGTFNICNIDNQPCVPMTPDDWMGSCSTVNTGSVPLLSSGATLRCEKCGIISIIDAGQSLMATETLEPMAKKEDDNGWVPDFIHDGLEIASNAPVIGTAAGAGNALLYAGEGDFKRALVEGAGAGAGLIPVPGARTAGKKVADEVVRRTMPRTVRRATAPTQLTPNAIRRRRAARDRQDRIRQRGSQISQDISGDNLLGDNAEEAFEGAVNDEGK